METLKIEQCDRDAAYGAYFECCEDTPNDLWLEALRAGKHDDDPQVQVIAAVRIAERERNAKCAEDIGESYGEDETGWFECSETIAQAIRAASDD